MVNGEGSKEVSLEVFDWEWDESDKDANFKQEVAIYSREDPMVTIQNMSQNLSIPVGVIVRYVLVKWATSGSAGLLEVGPRVVQQMAEIIAVAEQVGSDEERLAAYQKLSQVVSWLNVPLRDPKWRPGDKAK